jgi:hypothetical protein
MTSSSINISPTKIVAGLLPSLGPPCSWPVAAMPGTCQRHHRRQPRRRRALRHSQATGILADAQELQRDGQYEEAITVYQTLAQQEDSPDQQQALLAWLVLLCPRAPR